MMIKLLQVPESHNALVMTCSVSTTEPNISQYYVMYAYTNVNHDQVLPVPGPTNVMGMTSVVPKAHADIT